MIILKIRSGDYMFLKLNDQDTLYLDLTNDAETTNPYETVPEAGVRFPAGIKVPTSNKDARNMASMKPEECVCSLPQGVQTAPAEDGLILLGRISGNKGEEVD